VLRKKKKGGEVHLGGTVADNLGWDWGEAKKKGDQTLGKANQGL